MTRFTARAFRRRMTKKSKKTRGRRRAHQTRRRRAQKGGGDTFSREIPKDAVKANPMEWDD
jgi:hypothetical protein